MFGRTAPGSNDSSQNHVVHGAVSCGESKKRGVHVVHPAAHAELACIWSPFCFEILVTPDAPEDLHDDDRHHSLEAPRAHAVVIPYGSSNPIIGFTDYCGHRLRGSEAGE